MYQPMIGHLSKDGRTLARAGFLYPQLGEHGLEIGPSRPLYQSDAQFSTETNALMERIERGDFVGDSTAILNQLVQTVAEHQRAITSTMTAFPARENLEAQAKLLVPLDTPLRNLLPRTVGSGTASQWRQLTSLGGGWGTSLDQPGGVANIRTFFAETGAPAEHTEVYANKTAAYKLLGTFGQISGFARASGDNFQNQYVATRTNSLRNLMLNEENALTSGDSTSVAAPWGDGVQTLAFDGIINLVTTANGTPSAQVQTAVGPLTIGHVILQLTRIWRQGGQQPWILINSQESVSLTNLAGAPGSIIRVEASAQADSILGIAVTGIKHPITGEIVPIYVSRFVPAGTMIFGSRYLPDGSPAADVQVLPQVELPQLAPNEMVQGYVIQDLAPSIVAPQMYPWIISVYEVLRMKAATVFAKSTGVTAV